MLFGRTAQILGRGGGWTTDGTNQVSGGGRWVWPDLMVLPVAEEPPSSGGRAGGAETESSIEPEEESMRK